MIELRYFLRKLHTNTIMKMYRYKIRNLMLRGIGYGYLRLPLVSAGCYSDVRTAFLPGEAQLTPAYR